MLGLFDSGRGGINTVAYLKETGDDSDLVYLIDINHAPYGVKTEKEIIEITENNIKTLTGMGADKVLIACCTASTVYPSLSDECRAAAIPIISAVADEAKRLTRSGRVGVIATERTVTSGAFGRALSGFTLTEVAASELVSLIDSGLSDEAMTKSGRRVIEDILRPVLRSNVDTLILGCTHFPAVKGTVKEITEEYGDVRLVDSARVGADALRKYKYGK